MSSNPVNRTLKAAHLVLKALEKAGFEGRLAGGCVRDRLLGKTPLDFDIATTATPEEVCNIFKQKDFKTIPTGIDHGTITVVYKSIALEITTLRKDVATDGRRATVAFGSSFEEDAMRRDFTINALFENHQGEIFDYNGGRKDLKERKLVFVGVAEDRIKEDYLRILRFFRFWAQLEFTPDADALKAIEKLYEGISIVSVERITQEMLKHIVPVLGGEIRGMKFDA